MAAFDHSRAMSSRFKLTRRTGRWSRPIAAWAVVGALSLIMIERVEPQALAQLRGAIVGAAAPWVATFGQARDKATTLLVGGRPSQASSQAAEQGRMDAVAAFERAKVERENRDLRRLLRFSQAQSRFVAASVVSRSVGPVAQAVLISAGSAQGLAEGRPVVADDGLLGRTAHVQDRFATVVLLTDRASRVPVLVGANQVRAVVAGDGGRAPRLELVAPNALLSPGDLVITSGVGGVFPRGLAVGAVIADGLTLRVDLVARADDAAIVGVLDADPATVGQPPNSQPPNSQPTSQPTSQVRQSFGRLFGLPPPGGTIK